MLGAALRPQLLHDGTAGGGGSVLGFVDCTNCRVVDVPRLSLLAHCSMCFDDCALPDLVRCLGITLTLAPGPALYHPYPCP